MVNACSNNRATMLAATNLSLDSPFLLGTSAAKADYEAGCQPDIVFGER